MGLGNNTPLIMHLQAYALDALNHQSIYKRSLCRLLFYDRETETADRKLN